MPVYKYKQYLCEDLWPNTSTRLYDVWIVWIDWPDPCLETLVSKLTLLSQIQIMFIYEHIKYPRIVRRASLNIKGQFEEPITVFSVRFVLSDYQIVQKDQSVFSTDCGQTSQLLTMRWKSNLQRNFQKGVTCIISITEISHKLGSLIHKGNRQLQIKNCKVWWWVKLLLLCGQQRMTESDSR